MNNLKEWLTGICSFAIGSTVIHMILPLDRISDTVRSVIRLMLLILIFLPLCYSDFSFNSLTEDLQGFDDMYKSEQIEVNTDLLLDETEGVIKSQVEEILSAYYEGSSKIDIDADILSEQCIQIKQIRIILYNEAEKIDELKKAMKQYFESCQLVIEQEVKNDFENK